MGIAFSTLYPFCCLALKHIRTFYDCWWLENCILTVHFILMTMHSSKREYQTLTCIQMSCLLLLQQRGDRKFSETGSRDVTVKEEALVACEVREWSSLVHVMGISAVLSRPIVNTVVWLTELSTPDGLISHPCPTRKP